LAQALRRQSTEMSPATGAGTGASVIVRADDMMAVGDGVAAAHVAQTAPCSSEDAEMQLCGVREHVQDAPAPEVMNCNSVDATTLPAGGVPCGMHALPGVCAVVAAGGPNAPGKAQPVGSAVAGSGGGGAGGDCIVLDEGQAGGVAVLAARTGACAVSSAKLPK
jgi:hypothetical protein